MLASIYMDTLYIMRPVILFLPMVSNARIQWVKVNRRGGSPTGLPCSFMVQSAFPGWEMSNGGDLNVHSSTIYRRPVLELWGEILSETVVVILGWVLDIVPT